VHQVLPQAAPHSRYSSQLSPSAPACTLPRQAGTANRHYVPIIGGLLALLAARPRRYWRARRPPAPGVSILGV